MKNIEGKFSNEFVISAKELKIAQENAIEMQQLVAMTQEFISARDAELANSLKEEVIKFQSLQDGD